MTEIVCIVFGLLILCIGFSLGVLFEQGMRRRDFDDKLQCVSGWCAQNCKQWDKCFHDENAPDDALKQLSEHCDGCLLTELLYYRDGGDRV